MDRAATLDPTEGVNAFSARQGWPFRGSAVLEFDRPELNQLRDVWHEKTSRRSIPFRNDLDARALKPVLRNLVILERMGESGRYRIRLMGSEIVRLVGEGTGRFLDEAVSPLQLPRWLAAYDSVLDAQVPLRFLTRYADEKLSYLTSESFNAPMLDAQGNPTMLLSCAYFQSQIADTDLIA